MTGLLVFVAALLAAPAPALYTAGINLPSELFTADGTAIPKGKTDLEIRKEGATYVLAFLHEQKIAATVKGQPYSGLGEFTVPVIGTVLLWPAGSEKASKEETKSQMSPYLTNVPWKATLRLYQSAKPDNTELRAIFREGETRLEFPLFSAKPAKTGGL